MENLNSAIWNLSQNDFIKSATTAIGVGILLSLGAIVTQPGFDIFTVDWHTTINLAINAGVAAFFADILRRLGTDNQGKLLGRIG